MKLKKIGLLFFIIFSLILFYFSFTLVTTFKNKLNENSKIPTASNSAEKKVIEVPKPTLESIFDNKPLDFSEFDESKIVKLVATGDVIVARAVNWHVTNLKDYTYPFQKTAQSLKNADIALINLETPLIKNCPLIGSGFTFCGSSRHIDGLLFAGIDVASLSNNHIGNFGQSGINETKELLSNNNISWSGFGNLAVKEIKGIKFGFLAYNGIGTSINREKTALEIKASKVKVDVLVVSIHWGEEYVLIPEDDPGIAPDKPIEIGHLFIDSGADLIIGNHPHWVQGVEFYKDKLITYAHGNFIFDQTWSLETQEGVVGEYVFYDKNLIDISFKPIVVDKSYQPIFVEGERAQKIFKNMRDSSEGISKLVTN